MTIREKRSHERKLSQGRFMAKVGLDRSSRTGYVDALNICLGGMAIRPDMMVFEHAYKDFMPGKTIILLGQNVWNRFFSLSGTILWIRGINERPSACIPGAFPHDGYAVGIRINSVSSDAFFKEWIENGAPEPR